jgi:hypothetical protein
MYGDEEAGGITGDRDEGVAPWSLERDHEEEGIVPQEDPDGPAPDVEEVASETRAARFAPFDDLHGDTAGDAVVFDAADLALREEPLSSGRGDEFRLSTPRQEPPFRPEPEPEPEREPEVAPIFERPAGERRPAFAPSVFEAPVSPPPQIVERDVRRPLAYDADERDSYDSGQGAGEPRRSMMLPLALMLALGLGLGFAAGYFAGPGRADPVSEVAARNDDPAAPSGATAEPAAAAAAGRAEPAPARVESPTASPASGGATPAPAAGKLVVQTTPPGAAVTINGKPSGRAPLTRESLAFGDYSVRVVLPGYQTRNAQVRLSAGAASRTLSMQLQREPAVASRSAKPPAAARTQKPSPVPAAPMARPEPSASTATTGVLEIDSRPVGAQAFVDGRPVGSTPVRVPEVAPGGRVVRLELAAHRTWTEVAQVGRGRTTRVAGSLEPIR